MKNFRCYQLAKDLYRACKETPLRGTQRDQLLRASLSVCLNLAEGSAKQTTKERRRFYFIALGSQREVHALLDLENQHQIIDQSDHLGASLYKLTQALQA